VITEPVTVSAAAVRASIVPDTNHPHMFDHLLDHLPGNLKSRPVGSWRSGDLTADGVPADSLVATGVAANFGSFAELDLPTRVEAAIGAFDFDPARVATSRRPRSRSSSPGTGGHGRDPGRPVASSTP